MSIPWSSDPMRSCLNANWEDEKKRAFCAHGLTKPDPFSGFDLARRTASRVHCNVVEISDNSAATDTRTGGPQRMPSSRTALLRSSCKPQGTSLPASHVNDGVRFGLS